MAVGGGGPHDNAQSESEQGEEMEDSSDDEDDLPADLNDPSETPSVRAPGGRRTGALDLPGVPPANAVPVPANAAGAGPVTTTRVGPVLQRHQVEPTKRTLSFCLVS